MLTEKGKVYNLLELGNKFIEFMQKSDSNYLAWELLDDRLNSHYGATLKSPKNFYLSLSFQRIDSNTYNDFVMNTKHNFLSENYDELRDRGEGDTSCQIITKYGSGINAFKNTGEFLALGLHTLFDENLYMCEQPQITCEEEIETQENRRGLLQGRKVTTVNGRVVSDVPINLPNYPLTGCPWLTLSDKDKVTFGIASSGIYYYFTKDNEGGTITFRVLDKEDHWQSIAFGKLNTFTKKEEYLNCLYIAGGNQALYADIYNYIPLTPFAGSTYLEGNSYDLSIENPCMSNSNMLYPAKLGASKISNFRVLAPSGKWLNIFSVSQTSEVQQYFYCAYNKYAEYGLKLHKPVYNLGESENSANLIMSKSSAMVDSVRIMDALDKESISTPVEILYIVQHKDKTFGALGILGYLPHAFTGWTTNRTEGEITISGKKYLNIPNGWGNRKEWIEPIVALANAERYWNAEMLHKADKELVKFNRRLLIPFE